jgi:predicted RNA binding protein YcfA (HicA-like mRNA interferase family)
VRAGFADVAKARQVHRALTKLGWGLDRIESSHHIYKRGTDTLTFSSHDSDEIGRRLLAKVARQAGVTLDEFRRLL